MAELIHHRNFRLTVMLGEPGLREQDDGVLVAHGGQEGGYLLYLEAGQLVFAQNVDSRMRHLSCAAPFGARCIELAVTAAANRSWHVQLVTGGQTLARDDGFRQFVGFLPFEGIDVGIDRRSPVSWSLYQRHGPFPFAGSIESVRYEPSALCADAPQLQLPELRRLALQYE